MGTIASQITSLRTVYSTVYSDADQRKHQSSASLAFVRGIHRGPGPVNSPRKWPVTRKMFPFDDVIMIRKKKSSNNPIFMTLSTQAKNVYSLSCNDTQILTWVGKLLSDIEKTWYTFSVKKEGFSWNCSPIPTALLFILCTYIVIVCIQVCICMYGIYA